MIVLTGGAGFIGSCFLARLNREGIEDVLVVDELEKGNKWKNLVGKKFADCWHKDDFRSRLVSGALDEVEIEAVVHLGACSSTTETDADYLLDNNFAYSCDVAMWCHAQNVRLIYASSAATYGAGECGYTDTEFDALRPLNMYGFSKHMFDQWMIKHGLIDNAVGIKYFNVFGPNEYHKDSMASLVYKAWGQIRETGSLKLFKSYKDEFQHGEQVRDFVYVHDAVEVMMQMLLKPDVSGIYNLGTGKARSWNDLAAAVFGALKKEVNIEYIEMPESIRGQYQYYTQAEMSTLKKAGISHDFLSLEESVHDYINNYLEKQNQYC